MKTHIHIFQVVLFQLLHMSTILTVVASYVEGSHFVIQTASQGPTSAPTSIKSSFRPTVGPSSASDQSSSSASFIQTQPGFLAIYIDVPIAVLILVVIIGYCYLYGRSKRNITAANDAQNKSPREDAAVFSFGNLYPGREKEKEAAAASTANSSNAQQNPLLSRMFSGKAKSSLASAATSNNSSSASNARSAPSPAPAATGNVQRAVNAIENHQFATQAQSAAPVDLYEEREGPIGKKFGPVRPEAKPVLIVPELPKEGAPDTLPLAGLSSSDVCTLLESIGMFKAVDEFGAREVTGQMLSEACEVEDFARWEVSGVPEPILKALLVKLATYKVDGVPSKLIL